MLINVLKEATDKLEKNKTAQKRARDSEQFEANIAKMLQASNSIDSLLKAASEATQQELMSIELDSTLRNDLISTMQNVLEQLQERFLDNDIVRNFSRNVGDLKSHLDRSWNRSVSEKAGQITSSLETFGHFMPKPEEAAALKQSITSLLQTLPTSPQEVLSFAVDLKKGREMANEAGDDPEIKAFIKKVLANQASMFDMTPKVQVWIKEQNLERRMKISFM